MAATENTIAPEVEQEERAMLIQEISNLMRIQTVDSATWSLLWFSDIESLRGILSLIHQALPGRSGPAYSIITGTDNARTLKAWAARIKNPRTEQDTDVEGPPRKRRAVEGEEEEPIPEEQPTPEGETTSIAQKTRIAKKLCGERDQSTCLITKAGEPTVEKCHIYPFGLGKAHSQTQEMFWGHLSNFWRREKIQAWEEQILGHGGTEKCQNLLCLSSTVHTLWGRAAFALRPVAISEDQKSMVVQFYWLPSTKYTKIKKLTTPPSLLPDLTSGANHNKLWDCISEEKIVSGREIKITTDDPKARPLPSFELLQMQWALNRVTALSGAADVSDEILDDSDDDEAASASMTPVLTPLPEPRRLSRSPVRGRVSGSPVRGGVSKSPVRDGGENQPPVRSSSKAREDTSFTLPHRPAFR